MVNVPRNQILAALPARKYQCDRKKRWIEGKDRVEDWQIREILVRDAKNRSIPNAGVWAERAQSLAEQMPEYTTNAFVKNCMVRDRNAKTAGKSLFWRLCEFVGISIPEGVNEAELAAKNGTIVGKFYDALAKLGIERGSKRLRILGQLCRSLFVGWKLRDATADEVDVELKSLPPAETAEVLPEPIPDDPDQEFIITDRHGRRRRVTRAQIEEMERRRQSQAAHMALVDQLLGDLPSSQN